jgi:lipoprotein-anchoring transpeptidase ErfK/SrfK
MMRKAAALLVVAASALVLPATSSVAQSARSGVKLAHAAPPDQPAPRRGRRPPTRLYVYPTYEGVPEVYPRYFPGPNAVRECNATYVQEYRPSGTVIVPRMSCYWRPG